jgi:hypothetical protein
MGLFEKRKLQDQVAQQPASDAERSKVASFLQRAQSFTGTGPEDPTLTIRLRPGERALLVATGTYLVEPKRLAAYWSGVPGSLTFDVPRAGADNGLGASDTGDTTFTDQRIIFSGSRQPVEWEYSSLLGYEHVNTPPWTALAVSDRSTVSGLRYDEGQADEIRFAIALGISRYNNRVETLVTDLRAQLEEIDRQRSPLGASQPPAPAYTQTPAQALALTPQRAPTWQGPQSSWAASPAATDALPPAPASAGTPPPDAPGSDLPEGLPEEKVLTEDNETAEAPASPAEPTVESPTTDPPAEDKPQETGVPTGEIPAVPPTAVYPAVTSQPPNGAYDPPAQSSGNPADAQPGQSTGQNTPPGWYPDPWRIARVRWWDGYAWTAYTSH